MREIKFRGKRIDNGEWVYGYYCFNGWTDKEKHLIIPDYASTLYGFEVIPETVGQYTGLKDRNGKEIYEGDMLTWSCAAIPDKEVVIFEDGAFCVHSSIDNYQYFLGRHGLNFASEIIGNIHDNPELMKQEASNETT
jgi:uncharacterized phage protein (TIGR01671 family)